VRLEELGKLKKSTSSGFDPATFWLLAWCLNLKECREFKKTAVLG
jgi:hypothetical protein